MKHAIISGGCSGIGLTLVRHLLAKPDWRVIVADIRQEGWDSISSSLDSDRTLFVQTNVADWDSHAAMVKKAYEWSSNQQLDFYAANAGIGDRDSFTMPWDLDAEPKKPNLDCIEVNELANYYALQLFIHYARKTQKRLGEGHKGSFNPKFVMTSSCTALYHFPVAPQYTASKHAVLGFTRGIGPILYPQDNIAVNCIMPGVVDTNILPPGFRKNWPDKYMTPVSTLMRAYDELTDEKGAVKNDGKSDGKDGEVKNAQAVECSVDRLWYRDPVDAPDEAQQFMKDDSLNPDGIWFGSIKQAIADGLVKAGGVNSGS